MKKAFTVGAVAFCTLVLELAISRLSVFYLDYSSSYVAIPVALLGLAMGSLFIHLRNDGIHGINIKRELYFFFFSSFLSFATVFFLFSSIFDFQKGLYKYQEAGIYFKTFAFIIIFIFPFYYGGKILTVIFTEEKERIGQIYAADLAAAALACFVAPFIFHSLDLPYLVFVYFIVCAISIAVLADTRKNSLVNLAVLIPVSIVLTYVLVYFESNYDLSKLLGGQVPHNGKAIEVAHQWNEYSRVSLIRLENSNGANAGYRIIHDNAESNVVVQSFTQGHQIWREKLLTYMPYVVDSTPKDTLVMFAGAGAQMMDFYNFNDQQGIIEGVEINPLVKEFAQHEELDPYHIKEFYNQPNVNLHVMEGRQFLIHDKRQYDLIYAASDAATSTYKTGHSRKYLDTKEAMEQYFKKLKDGGMLMFQSKPSWPKLYLLKEIFEDNGLDFNKSVMVLSEHGYSHSNVWHHILLKKTPFTRPQVDRVIDHYRGIQHVLYAPYFPEQSNPDFADFLVNNNADKAPTFYALWPEDDNPYYNRLDFTGFKLIPDNAVLGSALAIVSWMKISTLVIILCLTALIMAVLALRKRENMPPASVFIFLFISGFCYMLCQVVFIGKLELFLESPLYSMALLISVFLFTNGSGAYLADRLDQLKIPNWHYYFPAFVAVVVLVCLTLAVFATKNLIHIHLLFKILVVIVIIAPVGLCLGVFYPVSVKWLVNTGRPESVPVTYGLSTLSSVIGATFAMTIIINLGYTSVLYQAILGYLLLSVIMIIMRPKMTG